MSVVLAGLFGAGFGLSVLVLVKSVRDAVPDPGSTRRRRIDLDLGFLRGRRRRLLVAVAAGAAAVADTGWPVLLVLIPAAVWWFPLVLGPDRESQIWIQRAEGCAAFAEMLRDTLAAASGLEQAVAAAAGVAPAAIAEPLRTLSDDLRLGVRLAPALVKLADTLADPIADRICATLIHASSRPARNLAPVLAMLAADAREQALAMRGAVAARSQIRTSARVITVVVTGMTALLLLADSAYLDPFGTVLGQLDLAVAGALFAIGFAWLHRMSRPVTPRRFLTRLDQLDLRELGGRPL